MFRTLSLAVALALTSMTVSAEQLSADPFTPIEATQDVIGVSFIEFATIPSAEGGDGPRLMHMIDEPETKRLFVSTMPGMLYSVSYDGKDVAPYLDINAANWGVGVQSSGSERGVQSFAFHPDFGRKGAPGFGKFYTYLDTTNITSKADFVTSGANRSHDTVLLEWTTKDPKAKSYDGAAPKEIFRAAQPYPNHNGGQIGFNTIAKSGAADYGLLYVGLADGGAGGDPLKVGQDLSSPFGKILRIDPLGSNSTNGKYGVPAGNPFVKAENARPEIYAYGVRNPQRFTWDAKDGRMYLAEIGQNQVEEISEVKAGANLGWGIWEGSYKYVSRQVDLDGARSDAQMVWPIVEYDHKDPLLQRFVAITGITVYRSDEIKALQNLMIFGDNPSGEIFYINADRQPAGGHTAIRRVLLKDGDAQKTFMDVIRAKTDAQGKSAPTRVDLRFGFGSDGRIYLLNKRDGVIRLLVPDAQKGA
jgi:glucose/arabinose dehydrogenase